MKLNTYHKYRRKKCVNVFTNLSNHLESSWFKSITDTHNICPLTKIRLKSFNVIIKNFDYSFLRIAIRIFVNFTKSSSITPSIGARLPV